MAVSKSASSNPQSIFSQIIIECGAIEKALEVSDTDKIVSAALIETLKRIEGLVSLFKLGWEVVLQENAALKKQISGGIEEKDIVQITKKNKSPSEGSLPKLSEIILFTESKLQEIKFVNSYITLLREKINKLLQLNKEWALKSKNDKILEQKYEECKAELDRANEEFKKRMDLELADARRFNAELMKQIDDYFQKLNAKDAKIEKLKDKIADLTATSK